MAARFAEADEEIGDAEGRHEKNDVGLVDQRPLDGGRQPVNDGDGEDEGDSRGEALLLQPDQGQPGRTPS
jgi:hypothetical protein